MHDQEFKREVHERAGGRCECEAHICGHPGRCNAPLSSDWQIHRVIAAGPYTQGNVIAVCEDCHSRTSAYGTLKVAS